MLVICGAKCGAFSHSSNICQLEFTMGAQGAPRRHGNGTSPPRRKGRWKIRYWTAKGASDPEIFEPPQKTKQAFRCSERLTI